MGHRPSDVDADERRRAPAPTPNQGVGGVCKVAVTTRRRQQAGARERQVVDGVDVDDVVAVVLQLEDGFEVAVVLGQRIA